MSIFAERASKALFSNRIYYTLMRENSDTNVTVKSKFSEFSEENPIQKTEYSNTVNARNETACEICIRKQCCSGTKSAVSDTKKTAQKNNFVTSTWCGGGDLDSGVDAVIACESHILCARAIMICSTCSTMTGRSRFAPAFVQSVSMLSMTSRTAECVVGGVMTKGPATIHASSSAPVRVLLVPFARPSLHTRLHYHVDQTSRNALNNNVRPSSHINCCDIAHAHEDSKSSSRLNMAGHHRHPRDIYLMEGTQKRGD